VVGAGPPQLALAAVDLVVEVIDQAQARLHRPRPRLRQSEAGEELAAAAAEEVRERARLPKGDQGGVDAVLPRQRC
jgi:hypothetical protein